MSSNIYIRVGQAITGPLPLPAVQKLIAAGSLPSECEASLDGRRWLPYGQLQATLPSDAGSTTKTYRLSSPGSDSQGMVASCFRLTDDSTGVASKYTQPNDKSLFTPAAVIWTLGLVLFPMVVMHIETAFLLSSVQTRWLVSGYYCLIYAAIIKMILRIDGAIFRRGIFYALVTAFVGIPVLLIWNHLTWLDPYREMTHGTGPWLERFVGHTIMAGFLEECCKLLPLIFIGMRKGGIASVGEGVWLGIMSGLGFAWAEGVRYSINYWNTSTIDQIAILVDGYKYQVDDAIVLNDMIRQSWLAFVIQQIRFITLPILHAGYATIAALGASYAFLTGKWWALGVAWIAASIIHGIYNSFAGTIAGTLISGCIVLLLLYALEGIRKSGAIDCPA